MPQLEILLFAIARDLAGADSICVDIDLPTTAGELMQAIGANHPVLAPWIGSCRLAVDQAFAPSDQRIERVVEIALIPPVSGG